MALDFDIKRHLASRSAETEAALERLLPRAEGDMKRLAEAMRYSIFAGGKRLRPALVLDACAAVGGDIAKAIPAACAVEMVHTYSLIHDDLPAMDDDDLRRGRPSCHKAFDEATAILAGDALLALAFEVACDSGLEVARTLARAAGPGCLVGGQVLDMETSASKATVERVTAIHDHKTADLIAASCRMGALAAKGEEDDAVRALERYGRMLGHAFQIADDLLDLTATPEELGKTPGKDVEQNKATYPAVAGVEAAKARAARLSEDAIAQLALFGSAAEPLVALARFVVERRN